MNRFTIRGRLPGLNELIHEDRTHWSRGAGLKADTEALIGIQIRVAMNRGECRMPSGPSRIAFDWHERNRRRDLDNVFSAKKFVLDAMTRCGMLRNDSQKYVTGLSDTFTLDKDDFVVVTITEEKDL